MNIFKTLLLLVILASNCGTNSEANNNLNGAQIDGGDSDAESKNRTDSGSPSDMGTDMGLGCAQVLGYTVDLSIPCKKFSDPDRDFGCLPCADAYCSGLAATGCYLSSDQSVVINSETISAPFDALLDMGWTLCSEKTSDGKNIVVDDLPICE